MLDFWTDLPAWARLLVALGLMIAGAAIFWWVSIRFGIAVFAVGFVLFCIGGKSKAEKQGYRF